MLAGCGTNRLEVDVSGIEANVDIKRFDHELFGLTAMSFRQRHDSLPAVYGAFYKHYIEDVAALGVVEDSLLFNKIRRFVSDPTISAVYDSVQKTFPHLDGLEAQLTDAWKHYKYYFPQAKVPGHIAFTDGFSAPLVLTENEIGIGLEMYLGTNSPFYDFLRLPVFLRKKMTPAHIAPSVMTAWVSTEFVPAENKNSLLDKILYEGKILYCLDAFFPEMHDSLKIGYTGKELEWARENEINVWGHFVDQALLYSTDYSTVVKYTNDGPFTPGFVKESPSRLGIYIGWQIVREYMDNNPKTTLRELMQMTDSKQLLTQSKYKP